MRFLRPVTKSDTPLPNLSLSCWTQHARRDAWSIPHELQRNPAQVPVSWETIMYEASNSVTAFTELLASAFGVMAEAGITQRVLPTAVQLGVVTMSHMGIDGQ